MVGEENPRARHARLWLVVALAALLGLVAASCGDDDDSDTGDGGGETEGGDEGASELVNACPEDGCMISLVDVVAEGDELKITWEPNFEPDVARNHIHVYWDTYEPDQVSGDAESRNVEQGDWVPTDANPDFVTEGAVSVTEAGDSTTVCVTAADGEHSVLDATIEDCRDVAELLAS